MAVHIQSGGIDEPYNLVDHPHQRVILADDPARDIKLIEMTTRMW